MTSHQFPVDIDPDAATALLDMLLLAIIRANPMPTQKRSADHLRLNDTKKALFGISTPKGRNFGDDLPELVFMAREYLKDRGNPTSLNDNYEPVWEIAPTKMARSVAALASDAIAQREKSDSSFPKTSREDRVHRLQKKIR